MRPLVLLPFVLALLVVAAGCGGSDPEPPKRPVSLTVEAPDDGATTDDDRIEIRGRVTPAASSVLVAGRTADVVGGSFSAEVELEEGANLVDVLASAPGRRGASTAVRIVRRVPVEVPDLEGEEPEAALQRLESLGLEPEVTRGGGLLDDLLPGEIGVCRTDPEAGTEVDPGTTVRVEVARVC